MTTKTLTLPNVHVGCPRSYSAARIARLHHAARERRGMRIEVHTKPHYPQAYVWALGESTAALTVEDGEARINSSFGE